MPPISQRNEQPQTPQDMSFCGQEARSIHSRFGRVASSFPDHVAISEGNRELTYAQLSAWSDAMAGHLQANGIGPGRIIGLHAADGIEAVAAMLGILKAGCAYLPLDPANPVDRLSFMLEDAGAAAVITQNCLRSNIVDPGMPVLVTGDIPMVGGRAPDVGKDDPQALAYVIYTSGSTGRPKGVMVSHRNVLRLFETTRPLYEFDEHDVWAVSHSFGFDYSVWEVWGALLHGGRLVPVPVDTRRSPGDLRDLLLREKVTILCQTPSAFRQFLRAELASPPGGYALRTIVFGGEALDFATLRPWVERYGDQHPKLINMYGITEITVHATYRRVTSGDLINPSGSLIGVPLPDTVIRILDEQLQPVPDGTTGEMHIGGPGVACGYLNRPELTEARFIADPFSDDPAARLYRTGDLGRRHADGDIEYLGRIDHQVKISGYRIELGEIEAALMAVPFVREAAAIVRDDLPMGPAIVAYVAIEGEEPDLSEHLRTQFRRQMPEYMVPSFFVVLDAMPLNTNGKTDRAALPKPQSNRSGSDLPANTTETQRQILQIWSRILGVSPIGLDEKFFDLGGRSLQVAQVHEALCKLTSCRFPITELFARSTVRQLADFIDAQGGQAAHADAMHLQASLRAQRRSAAASKRRLARSEHTA